MLAMVAELNERRIALVMGKRQRRQGGLLLLTDRQSKMLLTARRLHHRYLHGHYYHDETELSSIRDLTYWLLEEHAQNEGIKNPTKFEFHMNGKSAKEPLPRGTYDVYLQ